MEDLQKVISSAGFKRAYRQREQDFTRHRVLPFVGLVVSQINLMSKSVSVEVSRFVERFLGTGLDCSKQAFSQCRSKLKAEAFTALNRRLVVADAQQQVEVEQAQKQNRHRYKVNRAVALGLVKDHLAALLMGKEPIEQLYDRLLEKIKKRKEAVKPGRSYPRRRKLHYKFSINKRSVL